MITIIVIKFVSSLNEKWQSSINTLNIFIIVSIQNRPQWNKIIKINKTTPIETTFGKLCTKKLISWFNAKVLKEINYVKQFTLEIY